MGTGSERELLAPLFTFTDEYLGELYVPRGPNGERARPDWAPFEAEMIRKAALVGAVPGISGGTTPSEQLEHMKEGVKFMESALNRSRAFGAAECVIRGVGENLGGRGTP